MSFVTDLADELARDTIKAMDASGQERLFMEVAEVLAAASTTLEEEYLTCIRVRLAERRGRAFLNNFVRSLPADAAKDRGAAQQPAAPAAGAAQAADTPGSTGEPQR